MASRDCSQPSEYNLAKETPNKTIDIGYNGVSVSADSLGRILQLSVYHPEHGIAVAVPFKQFDRSKFYDQDYVREYRAQMLRYIAENKGGFGLDFGGDLCRVSIQIETWNRVSFKYSLGDGLDVEYTTQVTKDGDVVQTAVVTNKGTETIKRQCDMNLCMSLNRASYGQLTEGGPLTLPQSQNAFTTTPDGRLWVTNPFLGAQLEAVLALDGKPLEMNSPKDQTVDDEPLDVRASASFEIPPNSTVVLRARIRLTTMVTGGDDSLRPIPSNEELLSGLTVPKWKNPSWITTYILRRNVDYILANCVVPVSDTVVAVITDHVALPLGWNRDNYWQIRLLLETHANLSSLVEEDSQQAYAKQIEKVAKGHLEWVYNLAERRYKYWHRSYLVTGKAKDAKIFQLDQQCYPLLELCCYQHHFPEDVAFVKRLVDGTTIAEILEYLESKRDPGTRLWPTDETPGDDRVSFPYSFSSHVLLWRTYAELRDLWKRIKPEDTAQIQKLTDLAEETQERTLSAFVATIPDTETRIFAYTADGKGGYEIYHDANDSPTLFAREWGLLNTSDDIATWQNTMKFAFSTANKDGYCNGGKYRGLGSRHSPGTWSLGYFQELGYASLNRDQNSITEAWKKMEAAMQWDGTFPEAVDPETAKCTSKAWFSWPGSMIGALLIEMRRNGQEDLLK